MAPRKAATTSGTSSPFVEFGASGLRQFSGYIRQEWLRDLTGWQGLRIYREMRDSDPVIGAIFFAIESLLRSVSFTVEPGDETPESKECAAFVDSCFTDMEHSWPDLLSDLLGFLQFGYSVNEIVYKRRSGSSKDPAKDSRFDDGLISWRKFAPRPQETVLHWEFDESGDAVALVQLLPTGGPLLRVPLAKCLHLRTAMSKNNPEGRALAPETLIPTPDGWRELDAIQVGEKVFDEQGRIRYVTGRADWEDRPCFRVTFGDGTDIIADANHQWVTQTVSERSTRHPPRVRTTETIARRVKNTNGVSEHGIAWSDALDYPEQALAIDPYVLGLWLGDGNSLSGQISCHADDVAEEAEIIMACGYQVEIAPNGKTEGLGRTIRVYGKEKWARDGFAGLLTALGLRSNKHIPDGYLRGSMQQRMALLSGLMDSDGHVDGSGRCAFDNTNYGLAAGAAELVRSLGIGASIQSRTTDHGTPAWRVTFTPTWAPFRLARKAARCRIERQRKFHYITAVEPVPARRTVCIEVDSPSHLFLAGDNMVPTHNSLLRNVYTSYYFKKKIMEIEAIGIERDLAGLPIAWVPPEILQANATDQQKAQLQTIKRMVRDTTRGEQEGFVLPLAYDKEKNVLYKFELLSTAGRRQIDTDPIVQRYDHRIAAAFLADFLMLSMGGSGSRGSFAMAKNKTDLFSTAIVFILDLICAAFNRSAIPDLLKLNQMQGSCILHHGDVAKGDITDLATAMQLVTSVGLVTPTPNTEAFLREEFGAPPLTGDAADDMRTGGSADEQADTDAPETSSSDKSAAQGQGDNGGTSTGKLRTKRAPVVKRRRPLR